MAFSFSTTKMPLYAKSETAALESLLCNQEFWDIKSELDETIGSMEQTNLLIDNIQQSLDHLAKYGQKGIKDINADHGLEELMGIHSSMIKLENATAALEDAEQSLWDKFKNYLSKIWEAILNLFKALFGMYGDEEKKVKALDTNITKADDNKIKDTEVSKETVGTPEEAKKDVADIQAAATILVEVEGVNNELAAAIALITLDNDQRTAEAEAKIDALEAKLNELNTKLDKMDEKKEEAPSQNQEKKTKLGLLGWAKSVIKTWCAEFMKGYNEAISKANRAVENSARKSKENSAKLDTLNKAAKSKQNHKAKKTINKGRTTSSKAGAVAQKAASKIAKKKKKQSSRLSSFSGSANAWTDNYSADDNPEY